MSQDIVIIPVLLAVCKERKTANKGIYLYFLNCMKSYSSTVPLRGREINFQTKGINME